MPLLRRFPALNSVRRVALGNYPTPVQRVPLPSGMLMVKRDDLNAPAFGGNKIRALEFLLGDVRAGEVLLTAGGAGSTHVLAVAAMARRLGASARAVRWRHEMNPIASEARDAASTMCEDIGNGDNPVTAALRALTSGRLASARWIPLGGSSPLGILGHVNAGMELAAQVEAGVLTVPSCVVVPLGTGGTAAGLALGFAIAGLESTVIAARVAPPVTARSGWVRHLVRRTAALIERRSGTRIPRPRRSAIVVAHDVYGGAYGRPLPAAQASASRFRDATGLELDDSYAAKALVCAERMMASGARDVLFWLTFDGRWRQAR